MSRLRARPGPPRALTGDRGVTVAEMLVVVAIGAVISAALLGVLQSAVTVERHIDDRSTATAELERLFTSIGHDIGAGLPAVATISPPDADVLAIEVIDELGAATTVHWILGGGELRRVVLDTTTGTIVSDATVSDRVLTSSSFAAYGAAGTVLDNRTGEARRALCTTRYRIELSLPGSDADVSDSRDLAVSRRTPGANRC